MINNKYRHHGTITIWTVIEEYDTYVVLDDGCNSPIRVSKNEISSVNWTNLTSN